MRTYDFSPLFRSTIGFDRLFDLVETAQRATEESYPPYNIERLAEDRYQISLAVAGFSPDEVSITAEQNVVTIEGNKAEKAGREFLYRGISTRHFKRQFNLADYVQVKDATFDNGLLKIELVREIPEAMKPRRIAIPTSGCRASLDARHRYSSKNGGDHAADDRFQRQCFRHQRAAAPGDRLRSSGRRSDASFALGVRETRHPGVMGVRCISDRLVSRVAGTCRPQGTGHHR
jgi:molecular chaperone IbpA